MKKLFNDIISKYIAIIFHIFITIVISIITLFALGPNSDYTFAFNVIITILIFYFLYRKLLRNSCEHFGIKIICIITILISANHLYSYKNIIKMFPIVEELNSAQFWFITIGGILLLLLTIFIVYKYISRSSSSKSTTQQPSIHNPLDSNPPNDINEQVQLSENSSSTNVTPEMSISSKNNKEIVFSLLRVLGITIVLVAIIAVAIYLYLKLDLSSIPETPVSIPILSSFLIGHSASILFLLFSVTMLALVLIELARFLFNRIVLFKNAHSANTDNKNSLTHLLSILIVFSLIYYSFDFSNFTMDSFTELVSSGDYLAIPLVIIVGIVAVVLLIRLTHIILWLILKSEPVDIEKFVKENQAYIDLKK